MDELRSLIQTKLEEIQEIEVSAELPDDVIEEGKTYFSYSLQRTAIGSDTDKNFTYQLNIIGIIKRKTNNEENTLQIMDNAQDLLEAKFKELNIMSDYQDVTVLDSVKKVRVSGQVKYNEINKGLY